MSKSKKRIGILGAGASGLCAAHHCIENGYGVTVFEQQNDVGGTWIYSPNSGSFSSIYDNLVTNLPIQIMGFKHLEFKTDNPSDSFVKHQEVLAFLQRYAKPVRHLIQLNTTVENVEREENHWKVHVKQSNGQCETFEFDAIFVCNGHYWNPRIPEFTEKLKIHWIHSHDYRRPSDFADKNVAIVGAGPSGCDIAQQVCKVAKNVSILYNQRFKLNGFPKNVTFNNCLSTVENDGKTLILKNGQKLDNIDVIIFCTGYKYGAPFLPQNIIEPKSDGKYLSPLYLHMVHKEYPDSLFFLGLPWFVIPFTCFDYQVTYALSILNGTVELPSKSEMEEFEVERLKTLEKRGHALNYFYRLAEKEQWEYFDILAKLAKKPPVPIVVRKIFEFNLANQIENVFNSRNYHYKIISGEEFECERFD